jgi:hypothetical protein
VGDQVHGHLGKVIWAEQSLTVTPDQLRDALIR